MNDNANRRRRGANLEKTILDAAWAELDEHGYSRFTMNAVATRAGTSRPVLARRWDSRAALASAALRHRMADYPLDVPDRGDVRLELVEMLDLAAARATALAAAFVLFASEYSHDTGNTPAEVRAMLVSGETSVLAPIFERGIARGQVDATKLSRVIADLLPNLFRQHAFLTWSAPDPALRAEWIDTILLPLIRTMP